MFFPFQFHIGSCFPVLPFVHGILFSVLPFTVLYRVMFSVLPFTVFYRVMFSCSSLYILIKGYVFLFFPFSESLVYGHLGFLFFPLWFHIGSWLSVLPFTISQHLYGYMGIWDSCSSLYGFIEGHDFLFSLHNFIAFHRYMVFWDSCSSLYGFIQGYGFLFFPLQFHRGS